jgi:peroxiredoxin Q/BCP
MLKVGDKLPEFEGPIKMEKLYLIKTNRKKTSYFLLPASQYPTCTVEACNLSDNYSKLEKAGFQLLGVSGDSVKKQKTSIVNLLFLMILLLMKIKISLKNLAFGRKKDIWKNIYGNCRTTFIFDENGVCTRVIEK